MAEIIEGSFSENARWIMTLQHYEFDDEYRAGRHHQNDDTCLGYPTVQHIHQTSLLCRRAIAST